MKIPNKLKILGFDWDIILSEEVTFEGNCYGVAHSTKQKIYLQPLQETQTQQNLEKTFLHEIMHAIWWEMGLTKRPDIKQFEEEIISPLAQGLYQVLKDNDLLK